MSEKPFTAEGRAATTGQVVIVLQDEFVERASAAHHLRSSGLDVIEAADGDEARRILDENRVDVVLADLEMLGQARDLGFLRWLRERHPAIRTILTSDTETNMAAVEGCGIFLSKPYRLVDLDYCLKRVLAARKVPADQSGGAMSADRTQTGLGSSKAQPGSAGPNRPALNRADDRGDERFKRSLTELSRWLAERAAWQRAVEPGAARAARRAALEAYDRACGRRLRLALGFAMGAVVGSGIASLVTTVGSPHVPPSAGATAHTEPALSVKMATTTLVPIPSGPTELSSPPPASATFAEPALAAGMKSARTGQPRPFEPALNQTPLRRDEVREVQARLQSVGFNPGPVDGVAGARTAGAVMRYQQERGQSLTGTVDRELLEQLRQDTALQHAQRTTASDGQLARSRVPRRSDPFHPVWAAANRLGQWLEAQVR